jgi:hypothetical protein
MKMFSFIGRGYKQDYLLVAVDNNKMYSSLLVMVVGVVLTTILSAGKENVGCQQLLEVVVKFLLSAFASLLPCFF